MDFLFSIEDVFEIKGHRNIIVPGIPYSYPNPVGVGAKIKIETPNGQIPQNHNLKTAAELGVKHYQYE